MMVQTSCPSCGKTGRVPAVYLGRTVGCKRCSTLFKVRTAAASSRVEQPARVNLPMEDEYWLNDMPPIMVDILLPQETAERVPA